MGIWINRVRMPAHRIDAVLLYSSIVFSLRLRIVLVGIFISLNSGSSFFHFHLSNG